MKSISLLTMVFLPATAIAVSLCCRRSITACALTTDVADCHWSLCKDQRRRKESDYGASVSHLLGGISPSDNPGAGRVDSVAAKSGDCEFSRKTSQGRANRSVA
jgi:hypothetical protein